MGYVLRNQEGLVVASAPPPPIDTAGNRAVRRILRPVSGLDPGRDELADRLAGRSLIAREEFVLDPAPEG